MDCPKNQLHQGSWFTMKIIKYGVNNVKYVPQVAELCAECGAYKKFAPQTEELVAQFNQKLAGIIIKD